MSKDELTEEDVMKHLEECNESQDIHGFCYIPEIVCSKILDLYQKEKKKNRELSNLSENIKIFREKNFSAETKYVIALNSNYMNYLKLDYISKDKIREKIKELEDLMILFTNDKEKFNRYKYSRNILEKLLEE